MSVQFELYTRTGCHLCEEMEHEILSLESRLTFTTNIITINNKKHLEQRYGDKVPVLAYKDTIICTYVLNQDALKKAIKQYS